MRGGHLLGNTPTEAQNFTANALALSPDDIRRLLEDASTQTRVDITHKISTAYTNEGLQDREFKVAEQIFRLLLRDTEVRVRATLAEQIKECNVVPRDIVLKMARDVESVSLPILEFSEVLTESDLVELVHASKAVTRHIAISRRRVVPQLVSNVLLANNNDQVTATLVNNVGADISEADLAQIIEQHRDNEGMIEALSTRPRLPVATVEKLVTMVSGSLANTLKQKYQLDDEVISAPVAATRESETLDLVRGVEDDESIGKMVAQMHGSDRLTPSIILSSLCQGNFAFFESSLAYLSNIPVKNARLLIADKGDLGFRALYNKSGLPDTMFPAVKMLLKVVRELAEIGERPGKSRYTNNVVERLLEYSDSEPVENLSYIIALVRRAA